MIPEYYCILSVNNFLHHICSYLGISAPGVPLDGSQSLYKLVLHIIVLKADGVRAAAKIEAL